MKATIQQIAEKAGISRGTVDRALNNRGRVDPEVEKRIRKIAKELGYTPRRKRKITPKSARIKIGIITQLSKASFMISINAGIRQARKELEEWGMEILIRENESVDEKEQLREIEDLVSAGISGLAIMPVESEIIRRKLKDITDKNKIPVITFNSDIVGTGRIAYVGMDNVKGGRTAAGLLGKLMRDRGKVLIITGYFSNNVNNARVDGFVEELRRSFPDIEIAGVQSCFDNTDEVQRIVENVMTSVPGITGIMIVSGGQMGIKNAFRKLKVEHRPYVIAYDQTPKNRKLLEEDVIDFLIDQNGYIQGYRPPMLLSSLLNRGRMPDEEFNYTEINIKTKYNLN